MAVLFQALHIVREALGSENIAPVFQQTGDGPRDARGDLDWCMTVLATLVRRNRNALGPQTFDFAAVQEALAALNVGEVRPIFHPSPAPGKRSEAFTLAQHRLQAVGWRSFYLAQRGRGAEGSATLTVANAYGVAASTLRSWPALCERDLEKGKAQSIQLAAAEDGKSEMPLLLWRVGLPAANAMLRYAGHEIALQADAQAYRAFLAKEGAVPKVTPLPLEESAGDEAISGE